MSKYIDADKVLSQLYLNHKDVIYIDKNECAKRIEKIPSIDLDDYVPKGFHDKTCEAMAKRHQNEIADMVSVVRCKECKYIYTMDCAFYEVGDNVKPDDFCSYGEVRDE